MRKLSQKKALILAFFAGACGMHLFYMNKPKSGIAYCCLFVASIFLFSIVGLFPFALLGLFVIMDCVRLLFLDENEFQQYAAPKENFSS